MWQGSLTAAHATPGTKEAEEHQLIYTAFMRHLKVLRKDNNHSHTDTPCTPLYFPVMLAWH